LNATISARNYPKQSRFQAHLYSRVWCVPEKPHARVPRAVVAIEQASRLVSASVYGKRRQCWSRWQPQRARQDGRSMVREGGVDQNRIEGQGITIARGLRVKSSGQEGRRSDPSCRTSRREKRILGARVLCRWTKVRIDIRKCIENYFDEKCKQRNSIGCYDHFMWVGRPGPNQPTGAWYEGRGDLPRPESRFAWGQRQIRFIARKSYRAWSQKAQRQAGYRANACRMPANVASADVGSIARPPGRPDKE